MTKLTRNSFGCMFLICLFEVTEKRQTTEHEEFHDNELPEEDDNQSSGSRERIEQTVSGFFVFQLKTKKTKTKTIDLLNIVLCFLSAEYTSTNYNCFE